MADLKTYQNAIHENAKAKGFWDNADNANIPTKLMLIVSELSEALEEFRNDRMDLYFMETMAPDIDVEVLAADSPRRFFKNSRYIEGMREEVSAEEAIVERKPEGFGIELADALIRILDLAAYLGLDMAALVELKMEYNAGRPHMHGGRKV